MTTNHSQSLQFTGNGSEYFRIWIVNVGLSIITLGIYSAWAKVRRNQYFYRNTWLAGANFDYHGEPMAILKGRIIAFVMFVIYSLTGEFNPILGSFILLLIMLVMPWLLVRSFRFSLHNTSYRGLRFGFNGAYRQGYVNFFLWPLLSVFTLGMLWPLAKQRIDRYIRENSAYGSIQFKFTAKAIAYYGVYFGAFLIGMLTAACIVFVIAILIEITGVRFGGDMNEVNGVLGALWLMAGIYLTVPYTMVAIQNLLWNSTTIGEHGFNSFVSVWELLWLMISNFLLIILTLGLYKPYADIRMTRYRLEHLEFQTNGSIDDFFAGQQTNATAVGEEIADMFDFDIAL